ncbi:MAG: penicillin acylase family protein [Phycisphaerales bacterium]
MIPRHRRWRRLVRIGGVLATLAALTLVVGLLVAWRTMLRSLPRDTGELALAGLSAPVTVERDALGSPTITGATLLDAARAQGFVDAQERFFQMDLARRYAAGELSGLLGRAALATDRGMARYLFRDKAELLIGGLPAHHQRLLEAYGAGVNAGLADLRANPPEYYALRAAPEAWRPEDSLLAMYTMFRGLNFNDRAELSLGVMRDALPEALFEFLTPDHARDDAPILVPDPDADAALRASVPIPGPDVIDLRIGAAAPTDGPIIEEPPKPVGSNNFAIAGSRTPDGRAIIANDMHLGLSAPGTWRRVTLRWGDRFATGVSLPGVPGIVAGSNGRVAWGFTNVYGDFQDFRIVEFDPEDPTRFRTASDWGTVTEVIAEIPIKGDASERQVFRATSFGTVIEEDHRGRPMVLAWPALEPDKTNLAVLDMLTVDDVDGAVAVARAWYGPAQNVLIAGADGRIAWVMSGWLPNRDGYDGRTPTFATERRWRGALDESLRPVVVDPPSGALFTANNRTVGLPQSRRFGREWAQGDRAGRIGAVLAERPTMTEADLLTLQLDTRVAGYDVWRDLALTAADAAAMHDARSLIDSWNGHADADQIGYRLIRAFRSDCMDRVLEPLLAPCLELDAGFRYRWSLAEEPALRLLEARPSHLLHPSYDSWDALLEASIREAWASLERGDLPVDAPWGAANATAIRHPLTAAAPALRPFLSWLLDMPRDTQPGDVGAVRVARPGFGASERFVISPGHEEDAMLHLPTGNSGHPLSPHYADQYPEWLAGHATPLLPGDTVSSFTLTPAE